MLAALKNVFRKIVLVYAVYAVLSCIIAPIVSSHKAVKKSIMNYNESIPYSESVACIEDNTDALRARLRVIESAKDSLILSTFQLQNDNSSQDMYSALKKAADRGVHVKLLLDGGPASILFRTSKYFRALSTHDNVEIKIYNPITLLKPWTINYRMHSKCVVADDNLYIVGGRNTIDNFLGNYTKSKSIDRDILVYTNKKDVNNSINQVKKYFDEMWNLPVNKTISHKVSKSTEPSLKTLDERYNKLKILYPEGFRNIDWENETKPVKHIYYLSNPAESYVKAPQLWQSICDIIKLGKDIVIQTPYIICSNEMYRDINELAEQRNIKIVTNAVETGANPWGCSDYLNHKNDILATGVEIFEYVGNHSAHTKTVLVDNEISLVGSFNMDMRSSYLNTESMLLIESPEVNSFLRGNIESAMSHSRHILSDGTESDGTNCDNSSMGLIKEFIYSFMRIFVRPFRHLL